MSKKQKNLDRHVKIKVVGVGGAGTNAVDRLVMDGFQDVNILSINTDTQHLMSSIAGEKIQIGAQTTRGLGAGGNPQIGAQAAFEDEMELRQSLMAHDLIFLAAGMGGGTGTGAGPVIAEIARQQGALVLSLVTLPFSSEGKHRCRVARDGLEVMRKSADAVICIPNDRLLSLAAEETSVLDAFRPTDQFLCEGVRLIYSMLAKTGLINIDFADLAAVLRRERGETLVGYGAGRGEKKVEDAMLAALKSPLLSQVEILSKAEAALVCMTYGPTTTMREVNRGMEILQEQIGEETAIKVGYVIDETMRDDVSVLVIASTGKATEGKSSSQGRSRKSQQPVPQPEPAAEISEPVAVESVEPEPGHENPDDLEPAAVSGIRAEEAESEQESTSFVEAAGEVFVVTKPASAHETRKARVAREAREAKQGDLPLDHSTHGIFDKHERVIVNGQDLDQPTFLRLGIRLQRAYR